MAHILKLNISIKCLAEKFLKCQEKFLQKFHMRVYDFIYYKKYRDYSFNVKILVKHQNIYLKNCTYYNV